MPMTVTYFSVLQNPGNFSLFFLHLVYIQFLHPTAVLLLPIQWLTNSIVFLCRTCACDF